MTNSPRTVSVITAPFSGGQGKPGVDNGPQHLLDAGMLSQLESLGYTPELTNLKFVTPEKDPDCGHIKNPKTVSSVTNQIYKAVSKAARSSSTSVTLTVGGDHSIAIGTVAGIQEAHPDAVVLWIDAHADINTPAASESGNLHGCPLSFVVGAAEPIKTADSDDEFGWVPKCLDYSRLAYIGLRDVDAFEKKILRENNVAAFSMHHVDKFGIAAVVEKALHAVDPEGKRPIHMSFDVDAVDPFFAPATGTPVRGGLTWREACYLCEAVAETGRLVGLDLVECNPLLSDDPQSTIDLGLSLVKSALGDSLL